MTLEISSPGICPSNAGSDKFPNLARNTRGLSVDRLKATYEEVDSVVRRELERTGLPYAKLGQANEGAIDMGDSFREGEVPTSIKGFWHHWKFERAWYYYRAEGAGIPPDAAEQFHNVWGQQVRVSGHCMCPSPLEWFEGFADSRYHIDTQEGLTAFVRLLDSIYKPSKTRHS